MDSCTRRTIYLPFDHYQAHTMFTGLFAMCGMVAVVLLGVFGLMVGLAIYMAAMAIVPSALFLYLGVTFYRTWHEGEPKVLLSMDSSRVIALMWCIVFVLASIAMPLDLFKSNIGIPIVGIVVDKLIIILSGFILFGLLLFPFGIAAIIMAKRQHGADPNSFLPVYLQGGYKYTFQVIWATIKQVKDGILGLSATWFFQKMYVIKWIAWFMLIPFTLIALLLGLYVLALFLFFMVVAAGCHFLVAIPFRYKWNQIEAASLKGQTFDCPSCSAPHVVIPPGFYGINKTVCTCGQNILLWIPKNSSAEESSDLEPI